MGRISWSSRENLKTKQEFVRDQIHMEVKLGLQSYSLRKMPYEKAVEEIAGLGLRYVEAFSGHLPPEQASVPRSKALYEKYKVKLLSHGVNAMHNKKEELTALFDFAKAAGVQVLTADPDPESFSLLDELVDGYGIAVAIHNHGPTHRYGTIDSIVKAIQGHNELIGMCLDTGHLARSGEDITEAARKLGSRMHGLHLKDVDRDNKEVPFGTGRLDFSKMLLQLKQNGVLGRIPVILEVESNPDSPIPGIRESLGNVRTLLGGFRE
jgi:inosose dehydratase